MVWQGGEGLVIAREEGIGEIGVKHTNWGEMKVLRVVGIVCLVVACCGIGVNGSISPANFTSLTNLPRASTCVFDLWYHYIGLATHNRSVAQSMMHDACSRGFRQLRVSSTPFWPTSWKKAYVSNETAYFEAYELFLRDAHAEGCMIVPTLLWNVFSIADLHNESFGEFLRNPSSNGRMMLEEYVRKLIAVTISVEQELGTLLTPYWESTNELNLIVDLDLQGRKAGCGGPAEGTPTSRTKADNVSTADSVAFGQWMVELVRDSDQWHRPVSSGYATPRPGAYHVALSYPSGKQNFATDTFSEFATVWATQHAPYDLISVHLYPGGEGANLRFNVSSDPNSADLLYLLSYLTSQMQSPTFWSQRGWVSPSSIPSTPPPNTLTPSSSPPIPPLHPIPTFLPATLLATVPQLPKQLLLGEYGDALPGKRTYSHNVLATLQPANISLSTIWVWEFNQTGPSTPGNFSIMPGRDNAIIAALEQANM